MHTFDEYLAELRGRLRVGPRRAQEICEEARCHLEAQAQQFEQQGLSHDEAVARALAAFGEPATVAPVLTKANGQHYRAQVAKAVGLGVLIGAALWYLGMTGSDSENPFTARSLHLYGAAATICGGIFGGLCGLLIGAWQVRLRWIIVPFAAAPLAFLACQVYLLSLTGVTVVDLLALPREIGFALVFWTATPLAVAWAVHRWVLRGQTEPPAPAAPAPEQRARRPAH